MSCLMLHQSIHFVKSGNKSNITLLWFINVLNRQLINGHTFKPTNDVRPFRKTKKVAKNSQEIIGVRGEVESKGN